MLRTSIIIFTIIILATVSQAGDQSSWICMNGNQSQNSIQNCEDSDYQHFIRQEIYRVERRFKIKTDEAEELLREMEKISRKMYRLRGKFDEAQQAWERFAKKKAELYNDLIEIKSGVRRLGTWERECLEGQNKIKLWNKHLPDLDDDMKFFSQTYDEIKQQQQNPQNTPLPAPKGIKVEP